MHKPLSILLLSSLVAGLAGCGASATTEASGSKNFRELHSGTYLSSRTFTNKQAVVFDSQADYEAALATYTSEDPAKVDFSSHRVLLVDMGRRPTGGYAIAVKSVTIKDNSAVAEVILAIPGAKCGVTTALTNPYQFVAIETTKEILIHERLVIKKCGN